MTSGAPNSAQDVTVFINEWMASNLSFNVDPADGNNDDWFELYNPGSNPVDLTDYYLTDNLANPNQYRIPSGYVIPPHGFLLVWADNQPAQNGLSPFGDLHVNFSLSAAGEAIALFAPDGTLQSSVVFGPQLQNVSLGLYPEGSTNGGYRFMTNFTPRAANSVTPAPTAFPIAANWLANNSMVLAWPSLPGRTYRLEFKTALEDASWTQIGGDLSTSSTVFALTNSTGVATQRFFRVLLVR